MFNWHHNSLGISSYQSTLRDFPSLGFQLILKLHSEITFNFTIQLQDLPFYEMKLNLSSFKCTCCESVWTSFDASKVENKKDSIESEICCLTRPSDTFVFLF